MKPVWMETWDVACECVCRINDDAHGTYSPIIESLGDAHALSEAEKQELSLAAAAPEMLRLLMDLEDSGECPLCCATLLYDEEPHDSDCELDKMLTRMGFPDRASRNAARHLREAKT